MPTSDLTSAAPATLARPAARRFAIDLPLAKTLVVVNGLVPMALLVWDALHHELGANDVNFAIRTTGLVGLVMLMLSLAVTPLRRITGWNVIIGVRRALGLLAFFYLASHFVIFFVFDRAGSLSSTIDEILTRTYLQIGTIALVLMSALALTSTDKMVQRLGAKRWKLLHRLAYPIAILAVIHFLLLVKSDIRAPRAFAIVLGVLLVYRVVRHYLDLRQRAHAPRAAPATASANAARAAAAAARQRRFWSGELRVARVFQETHDVKTFRLVSPDGGPLPFDYRPGQYLNIKLDISGRRVNRSYTIASSPSRGQHCELSVKRAKDGYASHFLHDAVREGDLVKVSAPAGRFVFDGASAERAPSERVLLVAGGVGITPLMSMVRWLTDRAWPGDIYLAISVRTRADIIFQDELAYLERRFPNLHVVVTLSQPDADWAGARGHVSAALLAGLVPDLGRRRTPVFLCGPEPMMLAVRALLGTLGVAPEDVATEEFVSPPAGAEAAVDAAPIASDAGPADDDASATATVAFARSAVTTEVEAPTTLLEAAESCGVSIPFECRSGICGQCKTRLTAGRVVMEVQDALSAVDRQRGLVLACQARPRGPVTLDA
ncbi:MAG: ferric reductase-like transmembrane domain-containing protein [Myxococcota bacterium]